jgi:hypothetical protein
MSSIESEKQFIDLSRSLEGLVGELKKMNMSSIKDDIKKQGDIIERSLGNVKGSFRRGGKTKDDGNYLVGENGPEVVSLPTGSSIIPLDVSDLIEGLKNVSKLKDDLDDKILNYDKDKGVVVTPTGDYDIGFIKKQLEKEIADDAAMDVSDGGKSAEAVVALEKLQDKIKNAKPESKEGSMDEKIGKSAGPSAEEIKAERERLLAEDYEFYTEYPKSLQDDLDSYISSYNSGPGSSLNKTAEPALTEKEKSNSKEESGGKEKDNSKDESVDKTSKKKNKKEKKEKEGTGEGLFSKGKLTERKENAKSSAIGMGLSILEKKSGLTDKAVNLGSKFGISRDKTEKLIGTAKQKAVSKVQDLGKKSPKENEDKEDTKSKAVNEKPELNPPPKPAPPPEPKPAPTAAPAPEKSKSANPEASSKSETTETASKSGTAEPASSGASSSSSGASLSNEDAKDIKSLLSKIANTLAGPLNISSPDPFRPDSRRI